MGPVDLSHMASKEEAALTIRCPKDDPMSRRWGANHQQRLWSDPSWRPVNQLVTVFILDVEVFTLLVNSKASPFVAPKATCNC